AVIGLPQLGQAGRMLPDLCEMARPAVARHQFRRVEGEQVGVGARFVDVLRVVRANLNRDIDKARQHLSHDNRTLRTSASSKPTEYRPHRGTQGLETFSSFPRWRRMSDAYDYFMSHAVMAARKARAMPSSHWKRKQRTVARVYHLLAKESAY